jgi:hypothetical protein
VLEGYCCTIYCDVLQTQRDGKYKNYQNNILTLLEDPVELYLKRLNVRSKIVYVQSNVQSVSHILIVRGLVYMFFTEE